MSAHPTTKTSSTQFEIHKINFVEKTRHSDSPTPSILKTPTAIFVSTRSSSTKRLKFANGPVDLQSIKNVSRDCSGIDDSNSESPKLNGDDKIIMNENTVEVAVSPVKKMQVSPQSWKAFLEYKKKYHDYPNETEKTDYTYSRLSKFRHKEIIPGFLIRPNLSRSSITSSRKSSVYVPSNESSLSDSYLSYDFKVHSSPNSELNYDSKSMNKISKSKVGVSDSQSKYYLRSASLEDSDVGEIDAKSLYYEKEYFSDSAREKVGRKSDRSFSGRADTTSHLSSYTTKLRSLDLDDADIDEVDDNSIQHEKHYHRNAWLQSQPQAESILSYFSFATIFLYLTTVGTQMRDLFSKYVLRRNDHLREDSVRYAGVGGSGVSWTNEKSYMSPYYYDRYHDSQKSWYQMIVSYFYDRFSKISNLIMGNGTRYASYRYQQAPTKRKMWWLLLPLLILAGLWLFKTDQKYGIISNQYKALDCKTNGFLTSVENAVKPIWKSGYITYKRAAASASCYVNDSLERLKLPFSHLSEWLSLKFSGFFDGHLMSILNGVTNILWQGLRNVFNVFRDAFTNLSLFLFEFFTDLMSAVIGVLDFIYRFFKDVCFKIFHGFVGVVGDALQILKTVVLNVGSFVHLLMFPPGENVRKTESSEEVCFKKEEVGKLSSGVGDIMSISWDLSDVKKKIGQLEQEFRMEKESIKSRNQFYDKQLENNYLILQKYQATVNHALTASKKPGHVTSSSIQHFLDNHSDSLKQWILQNFVLKADSTSIDENKIALLIAKESNRSEEELLMLKQEFKKFILNHKKELESLRSDFSSLVSANLNGDISVGFIKKLVRDAIKLYDADKTGRADYALETAGGQVLSIRCTETYIASPKSYILLGWAVYTKTSSPRDAISPGMAAGQCWAFVGSQGFLVLQLSHTIQVTGFSMEHISKSLVPIGHIESAPKNFSVWGLKSEYDVNPYLFGEYSYLDNDETLQYFPVAYPTSVRYNIVELKIVSNHGNLNYTCLYRIRVHGELNPA